MSDAPKATEKPNGSPKKKRSWPVRILRGFLYFVLLLVVLVGCAVGYLHTSSGQERVRALIVKRLGDRVNGTVELDAVDFAIGGDIALRGLRIRDQAGETAVSLEAVKLSPRWGALRSSITLDEVMVKGLHVTVVKDAEGGSNLKSLFKPREESSSSPISKVIDLKQIVIEDVDVTVKSADGTELSVHHIAISGHVTVLPSEKNVDIDLDPIALGVDLKKADKSGGLVLGVKNLKTGVSIALTGGQGKLRLKPLSADLALLVPGTDKDGAADRSLPARIDRSFPIGFEGIELDVGEGDVGASLEKLALGAVSLASIDLKGNLVDGSLSGAPAADVVGLHVDASQVNGLLGKELLLSDVDLEAHLKGAASTPELAALLSTQGGIIKLDAKLDTSDPAAPKHDVTLTVSNVDTDKLLSASLGIPKIEIASLKLHAQGKGKDLASISTDSKLELSGIKARGVTVDSLGARVNVVGDAIKFDDLEVLAIDQHIAASGTFDRGTKKLSAKLSVDGDVGVALAKLKAAGLPITTNLAAGLVKLPKGDLAVRVDGTVGGDLEVTAKTEKLSALGGTVKLDAKVGLEKGDVSKGEKSIKLKTFDATLEITGLSVSRILAMRGKVIPPPLGIDGAITVHLGAKGTTLDPKVDLRASVVELRKDGGARARVDIVGKLNKTDATLDVSAKDVTNPDQLLFSLTAALPITLDGEKKGLDASRGLDVRFDLPRRPVATLVAFVPPLLLGGRAIPRAEIEMAASLKGAVARPTASVRVEASGAFLSPDAPKSPKQRLRLDVALDPVDKSAASKASGTLSLALDETEPPVVSGRFGASFPYSPLVAGATAGAAFDAHFELAAKSASLPDVLELARLRALAGSFIGSIDLRGNPRDLTAEVRFAASDLKPDGIGPLGANIKVDLLADKTTVDVGVDLAKTPLLKLTGPIALAGKGLFAQIKAGLDPKLDLSLEVPSRPLKSLAALRPKLAKAPGTLSGLIKVDGTTKQVMAAGALKVSDVATWDGQLGGAAVTLKLDEKALVSTIGIGSANAPDAPLQVVATIAREQLFGFKDDHPLQIAVTARATKTPIARLVPKELVAEVKVEPKGALDWNMDALITLAKKNGKTVVDEGKLEGQLKIAGTIPLPGSKRVYEDVDISILAKGETLTIERVQAKESDVEVKGRSFSLTGSLVLDKLKPKKVDVSVKADRWLLFGPKALGLIDAPRGSLTIEAKARGELDRPIKNVTVDIDKLQVLFPDRFDKAHQPEDVHAGDVVILGELAAPALGKLPLPESLKKAIEARVEAAKKLELESSTIAVAKARLGSGGAEATLPPTEEGTDIDIHIAKGARLFQSPLDLKTSGTIAIAIRPAGRTIRGKLTMEGGELSLGGKMHPLKEGNLVFDEERPQGWVDLHFEKPLAPWQLRNISEASAKKAISIHIFGPIADRRTVLSGAGSPGGLVDLLSMHNTGRERLIAEPDMPDSYSVDFPQAQGLLALSFISVNLPHLLFLDRVSSWSDPYDDGHYGRLEHYDGERYFADGKGRVKAQKRPAGVGRSEADIEVDYLFVNDPRLLFGIGGAAGSRGGGGPGVVLEWSSKD